MKFIYLTDPHVRVQSPTYRLDDYYKTILSKLDYARHLGEENGVVGTIIGGDLLDRPDVPYTTLSGLCEVLRKFKTPVYVVLGNHDVYGYNPNTFHRTALSVLEASGLIHRLSMEETVLEQDDTCVCLTGVDAHSALDKNGQVSDYIDVPRIIDNCVYIHVVHGFLAVRPWPMVPVTTIDSIINTNADIVLTGHEHSGFGVIEKNGRLFCNPGALGRVTASVGDVNLEVKVALIEVCGMDKKIELLKFPPNIARPASEVIDRAKLEQDKEHKQTLLSFSTKAKETMQKFDFNAGFNLYGILNHMIEEENISEEISEIIRKYIAEAEEELRKDGVI